MKQLVRLEVESYRLIKLRFFSLFILLVTLTASIATCVFILISMFQPLVHLKGDVLNGVVCLIAYQIDVVGRNVHYPPLDSLKFIASLLLIKDVVILTLSVMSVYGLFVKYRAWISLVPVSSSSSALLISLMFSLLRVYTLDVIPVLTRSVTATNLQGVFIVEQPEVEYTWLSIIPRKPIYFLICFNILLALTVASLMVFLYTPHPPISVKKKDLLRKLKGDIKE